MSKNNVIKHDFSKEKSNQTELEIQDVTYRFEEMYDSIEKSLDNLVAVQNEQTALIDLVKSNDADKKFEKFIDEMTKQSELLEQQRCKLVVKKEILKQVIDAAKTNEVVARNISMLCKAIGMFEA